MKISYETLYLRSLEVEKKLIKKGIASTPILGRFKEYQKEIHQLDLAWKNRKENKEDDIVSFGGIQVLALKELREIVDVLIPVVATFDNLPKNSKAIVKQKINTILTGATYVINERGNTSARNFQFEFRLAAKLIEAGYSISFYENPDIVVEIKGKRYAIECKRITGKSSRVIQANIEEGVEQLIKHKANYYAGILALDVSALLDKRMNILTSTSRSAAGNKVLDDIEVMIFRDFKRYQKLRKYSHTHLVSLFYNFSGSYVIESKNDVGWAQGTGVLIFSEENPIKAKTFGVDFANFRKDSWTIS